MIKSLNKHKFLVVIVLLLLIILAISLDLFRHASYDSRLGFMGAVIGLPTSILITVTYNDYTHRRDYMKSITEDLYNIMSEIKRIETKSRHLGRTYGDMTSKTSQPMRKFFLSTDFTEGLTDTSTLSDLLTNVESFYKKRKMRCLYASNRLNKRQQLDEINQEEYRTNEKLKPLISSLAVLSDNLDKKHDDAIQNACTNVTKVASQLRRYFQRIPN